MSTDTGFSSTSSSGGAGGSDPGGTASGNIGGFSGGDHSSDGLGAPGIDLTDPGASSPLTSFSDSGPASDEPNTSSDISLMQMLGLADAGTATSEPGSGTAGGGGGQDTVVNPDVGGASADTPSVGGTEPSPDSGSQEPTGGESSQSDSTDASFEVHSYSAEFAPGGTPESGENSSDAVVNPSGVEGHSVDNPATPGADVTFFTPEELNALEPTHSAGDHPHAPESLDPQNNAANESEASEANSPGSTAQSQSEDAAPQSDDQASPPQGINVDLGQVDAAPTADGPTGPGSIEWAAENIDELSREGAPATEPGGHPEGSTEGSPTGELHGGKSDDGILDMIHNALDALGMIPALGVVPDAVNTGLYLIEGDWRGAGLSATAMVPLLGQGATLSKHGLRLSKEGAEALGREGIESAARQASTAGGAAAKSEPALRASARRKAARIIKEQAERNGSHPAENLLNATRTGLVTRSSRRHSYLADDFFPDAVHGDTKASGAIHRLGIGDAHINQAMDAASERKGAIFQRVFYDVDGLPMDSESIKHGVRNNILKLSREQLENLRTHPGWFPGDL